MASPLQPTQHGVGARPSFEQERRSHVPTKAARPKGEGQDGPSLPRPYPTTRSVVHHFPRPHLARIATSHQKSALGTAQRTQGDGSARPGSVDTYHSVLARPVEFAHQVIYRPHP